MSDPSIVEVLEAVADELDPFEDDTPLACGIENPEGCESCQ